MDDKTLKKVQEMQEIVNQMKLDDIEENPESEKEYFDCDCCGKSMPLAGSVLYSNDLRLCNNCVLLAEVSFALNKIKNIDELLANMEDVRLSEICDYIKKEENKQNN